jgi:hypothetical protein
MHAAFGRVIVKSVGEWHYLSKEVDRLKAGYASFPRDVAAVLSLMGDGEGVLSAATISSETGIPEKRVKEVRRALKVLGLTQFGVLCDADADGYIARGSGYWLSRTGDGLAAGLQFGSTFRKTRSRLISRITLTYRHWNFLMRIRPIFAWYDFWIGVFFDRQKRRIYILPLPCLGVIIELGNQP